MKKMPFLLLVTCISTTNHSYAQSKASDLLCGGDLQISLPRVELPLNLPVLSIYPNSDSSCKAFPFDPYEMPARLIGGSDANQCMLTTLKRPIVTIPDSELSQYGLSPKKGYINVANFKHEGKFHVAQIPIDSIESAILHSSKMTKIGPIIPGHGQVRLKFSEPILLVEQDLSSKNKQIKQTTEIVSSLDAVGAVAGYEPLTRGLDNSYMGILNLSSVEQKAEELKIYHSQILQYKLKLDKEDLKKYLKAFISYSEVRGTAHRYNTLTENCGQIHLDILDRIIDYKKYGGLKPANLGTLYGYVNPDQIVKSFERRGLSSETERIGDFHNDPKVSKITGDLKINIITDEKK